MFHTHFWDEEARSFTLKLEDEIIQSALVTAGGEIRSELLKKHYESL